MELPVAPQIPSTPDALVRAIKHGDIALSRNAAQETALDGAVAFTNPKRPSVHMCNFAAEVRVPEGTTAENIVAQVQRHFQDAGVSCWTLKSAHAAWPQSLIQVVEKAGYAPAESWVYRLHEYRPAPQQNRDLQILPSRAAFDQYRQFMQRGAAAEWGADERVAGDLADTHVDFLDEPRLESFLGRLAGKPAGVVEVLSLGDLGVITEVFTDAQCRRQGVAARLLDHAIDYARRSLFQQLILETGPRHADAVRLYEAIGFVRVASFTRFRLASDA